MLPFPLSTTVPCAGPSTAVTERASSLKSRSLARRTPGARVKGASAPTREAAIEVILSAVAPGDAIVSTTGYTSRELYEIRDKLGSGHEKDFLTVGSMGHALAIAQGVAAA